VCDEKGKWYNEVEVGDRFINQFQTFLGANGMDPIIEDAENLFTTKLLENEALGMIRDVTDLEIKKEIFDIDNDKGHGPNGFTALFFKKLGYSRKICLPCYKRISQIKKIAR
nr:hypothetical protein [Tanacetum cinerariifolium]